MIDYFYQVAPLPQSGRGFFYFFRQGWPKGNKEQPYGCFETLYYLLLLIILTQETENMSMKYIRTYKVIYSNTILPKNETLNKGVGRGQFASILEDNGIDLAASYATAPVKYGVKTRNKSKHAKISVIKHRGRPAIRYTHTVCSYDKDVATEIINELCMSGLFGKGNFGYDVEDIVVDEEYWRSINGEYVMARDLSFLGDIEYNRHNMALVFYPEDLDGEPITVTCQIKDQPTTQWSSFKKLNTLAFTVTWDSKTVQRKEAIEEYLVQFPLSIIAHYQAKFEKILAESEMGEYPPEFFDNVEIDCHFDAISESRSECTPDIINQVREAKNAKKKEMVE